VKVSLIANYWKNSDGGGIKTYLVSLVDTLTMRGVDVDVIFRDGEDPAQLHGPANKFLFAVSSYRHLQRCRPETIHSQESWYCLLPGVLYKKVHGCRLIHTFLSEPRAKMALPAKIFFQTLLSSCDCVTFVSRGLRERVIEIDDLSLPRTAITYAGVTVGDVSDDEVKRFRDAFGIPEGAIVLAAIGMTAYPFKVQGLKLLIQAVAILRETYPGIVLVATREGPYSEELREFAKRMQIEENVIFTGNVENPQVPLKLCDIYTHITLGDGLPMALLEAMAMGKPIVATRIAGIPEAITDRMNGLLVEPEVGEVAEKISFLLQNRDVGEQLGMSARRTAEERFTWSSSADLFQSLYSV